MSQSRKRQIAIIEAMPLKWFRERLLRNQTVYAVERHRTRTGHKREISLFVVRHSQIVDITRDAALVLHETVGDHRGIVLSWVGADIASQLVYRLGRAIWPHEQDNGSLLNRQWL